MIGKTMLENKITSLNQNRIVQNIAVGLAVLLAVALFLLTVSNLGLFRFSQPPQPGPAAGSLLIQTEKFKFAQPELRISAGSEVELTLMNADLLPHSFDVDELDLHLALPARDTAETTLTISQPGTYTFYCAIPGHREAGMTGTLIVEP